MWYFKSPKYIQEVLRAFQKFSFLNSEAFGYEDINRLLLMLSISYVHLINSASQNCLTLSLRCNLQRSKIERVQFETSTKNVHIKIYNSEFYLLVLRYTRVYSLFPNNNSSFLCFIFRKSKWFQKFLFELQQSCFHLWQENLYETQMR